METPLPVPAEPPPPAAPSPLPIAPAAPKPVPPAGSSRKGLLPPTQARRLVGSLVLFFCAILFLRAVLVEPFGVPTGSMAPTLTGNHRCAACPRCGFPVCVGDPGSGADPATRNVACCPNCGFAEVNLEGAAEVAGDRLLVDKNVFHLRRPRRWEVAVFRCPSDPGTPYVKRVVALPGERVHVHDGDVYVNGDLARKTLAECREARVLVFEQRYAPQPGGWADRWLAEEDPDDQAIIDETPAGPEILRGPDLAFDGTEKPLWLTYRNWSLDAGREQAIRDHFAYNGSHRPRRHANAVHDFFVECEVEVLGGSGTFALALTDGLDRLTGTFAVGAGPGGTRLVHEKSGAVRSAGGRLEAGKTYRLELALADRRCSLAIDGREPFAAYDLPAVPPRPDVARPLRLGAKGVSVRVKGLRLYRDVYYTADGRQAVRGPHPLGPEEYFVLGDNSANSEDSRMWPVPGVPGANFLGKPFLLHQPSRRAHLEVGSRRLELQSIDWSRVRWIR